ncbi:MAG: hypothetical protein ACYCQJ_01975 [Nitrososphaerales archaeon]
MGKQTLRLKELTGTSRVLLLLTLALFVVALYAISGGACSLGPSGGCGAALVYPGGFIIISPYWPLTFVPAILALLGFIYSVKWARW